MALVTTSQVKGKLRHLPDPADAETDALIANIIDRVEATIARWLGYQPATVGATPTLETASYTRYFSGDEHDRKRLQLDHTPVTAITSVHSDVSWVYGAGTEIVAGDRTFDGDTGELLILPSAGAVFFAEEYRSVRVVFDAGFAVAPTDLVELILEQARFSYYGYLVENAKDIVTRPFLTVAVREGLLPFVLPVCDPQDPSRKRTLRDVRREEVRALLGGFA